ncbi:sugar kinase [Liquorilactobacillus mali]|uniref:sugar kinase n=1 Tax=Liquorilactobacillus mali TaxID=1618 RepID=UPI00264B8F34|nr:sugar kinase [Liquorilactobacillus mali]MDN7144812.1 sugar kinase [Liquorilactobacillus mali]
MIDFLTIGEPLVVFAATETDKSLASAKNFRKYLAGAELNTAIGLARLGFSTEYISRVGSDPLGQFIINELQNKHVGAKKVAVDYTAWTGFEMKQRVSTGDPHTFYFRTNSAATRLSTGIVDKLDLSKIRFLHLTGIYPSISDNALKVTELLLSKAKKAETIIIFDPNLRPSLWQSKTKMIETINSLASKADIFIPGIKEACLLTGLADESKIGDYYLQKGCKSVVIKMGASGAYLKNSAVNKFIPGYNVKNVVDTVGAGDGFAVGLISGLLDNLPLSDAALRGNAIGALAVQSLGDSDGYPTRDQLDAFVLNNLPTYE